MRYATVAFAMRPHYTPQKNELSPLPEFRTLNYYFEHTTMQKINYEFPHVQIFDSSTLPPVPSSL